MEEQGTNSSSHGQEDGDGFYFVLSILVNVMAGLLVFREGMSTLSRNIKAAVGDKLKEAIRISCGTFHELASYLSAICVCVTCLMGVCKAEKPTLGLLTGVVATACLSSATVASVMVVDFISVNAMTFSQSLAVCLGINVGSTLTPHLAALKLSEYYAYLIVGGKFVVPPLFARIFATKACAEPKSEKQKTNGNGNGHQKHEERAEPSDPAKRGEYIGDAIFGLGLLFLGMDLLNTSVHPLQTYEPFLRILTTCSNPLLALIISCVTTIFLYSSSAFLGIVMALANQGLISMELTTIFVLGTNIGAGAQPVIASFGKAPSSKRMAAAYAIFRGGTAVILFPFLYYFENVLLYLGGPKATMATHIANAHSLFNILAALFFFPFTNKIGQLVESMIPSTEIIPPEQKEKK